MQDEHFKIGDFVVPHLNDNWNRNNLLGVVLPQDEYNKRYHRVHLFDPNEVFYLYSSEIFHVYDCKECTKHFNNVRNNVRTNNKKK